MKESIEKGKEEIEKEETKNENIEKGKIKKNCRYGNLCAKYPECE